MRNFLGKLFLTVGILCLLAAAIWTGYNLLENYEAGQASKKTVDQLLDDIDDGDDGDNNKSDVPLYILYPEMDMPAKEINGYRYIGYLEIPDKNLKLPVMEEWSYDRLRIAPCRYEGSVYLNNMVIAGHNYISHFWPIKSLKEGAEIIFTDMDKNVFRYELAWTDMISPDQPDQMTQEVEGEEWDLTLFTCTAGNTMRYAARCTLVEDIPYKKK